MKSTIKGIPTGQVNHQRDRYIKSQIQNAESKNIFSRSFHRDSHKIRREAQLLPLLPFGVNILDYPNFERDIPPVLFSNFPKAVDISGFKKYADIPF
jgi:hypothetical protein